MVLVPNLAHCLVFVGKVLLEHSHTCLFMNCVYSSCFHATVAELGRCDRDVTHISLFTICPFMGKVCQPLPQRQILQFAIFSSKNELVLLGIYPKELKVYIRAKTCTRMLI